DPAEVGHREDVRALGGVLGCEAELLENLRHGAAERRLRDEHLILHGNLEALENHGLLSSRIFAALGAADVAPADQAQVIAEMWLQPARPIAPTRLLPFGRLLHLGRRQMIERHVLAVTGAAEAPGAEHAGDGRERRDVLLIV